MKMIKKFEERIIRLWYMQPEEHREAYLFLFMCFVAATIAVITLTVAFYGALRYEHLR